MLELRGVSKKFDHKRVLNNLSVTIEKGHIYGLLGPNGSGKTTMMKAVVGLNKLDSGSILLNGQEISYKTNAYVAYMPTEGYFYPHMNIKDLGKFYDDFYDDFSMAAYKENIEKLELNPNMRVKTLSSGMTAKLKLAVVFARNAEIIMLDEPLNGIDLIARDQIMSLIVSKSSQDNAIIISSHLVEELEKISDRVLFLKDGQIIFESDMDEMRENTGESIADSYRRLYGISSGVNAVQPDGGDIVW